MLLAENIALRKAAAAKENTEHMIPRPPKGTAGNGFNLQSAMGLEDNQELYATLRVKFLSCVYNCLSDD
jgi:hypothetical protein